MSARPAADPDRPPPDAPACATSPPAARYPPRRAPPADRTQPPAGHHARLAPQGTSVVLASLENLLSGGRIVLLSRPPRNPGQLNARRDRPSDRVPPPSVRIRLTRPGATRS